MLGRSLTLVLGVALSLPASRAVARAESPPDTPAAPAPAAVRLQPGASVHGEELFVRRWKTGPSTGMLASGITLLCTANAAAMIGGGIWMVASERESGTVSGGLLMIPVVGPFLAPIAGGDSSWHASWALLNGGAQLTGLILTIAGARYKDKKFFFENIRVSPLASSTMQGLGVSGRF